MSKLKLFLNPALFGFFFIFFLFVHNREQVLYRDLIIPLSMMAVVVMVSVCICYFIFRRNAQKTELAATFILVFFFAYGFIFDFSGAGSYWIRHRYLLPIWVLIFFGGILAIFISRRNLEKLSRGISFIFLGMTALSALLLMRYEVFTDDFPIPSIDSAQVEIAKNAAHAIETLPDIYYILPDAYASSWALEKYYGYDNSAFVDFLEKKGFYVVPKSRSNYTGTAFSMASLLNIEYLEKLSADGKVSRRNTNPRKLIEENRVGPFFQDLGYSYIHLGSWWEGDFRVPQADENINKGIMSEFMLMLFKRTVIYPASYTYGLLDDRYITWQRMRYQLDEVAKIPLREEPTFTFFHLGAPHGPQVFNADGSFIETLESELARNADDENVKNISLQKKYYPGQLTYVTVRLEELIDIILSQSKTPPIIVIQSDHGSSLFSRSDPDYERNRLKNFSAFYLPEIKDKNGKVLGGDDAMWGDITPVNTFRLLFNEYFGAGFVYLPDISYAFSDKVNEHPDWSLVDVTDLVANDYEK